MQTKLGKGDWLDQDNTHIPIRLGARNLRAYSPKKKKVCTASLQNGRVLLYRASLSKVGRPCQPIQDPRKEENGKVDRAPLSKEKKTG